MAARAWTATIAGDGDQAGYEAQIASLGLGGRVRMPGWQDARDAAALLAGASVLVLPSYHEVMPVAVLEAMARGLAIVTTPVGSVPEILEDGVSALLVPPGDVPALAGALARLVDDAALRVRLGEAAHGVWARRLDAAVAARALQAVLRGVVAGRQPAAAMTERAA
jgi:glycosyltransferase involved in cell wall biosynthesis